MAVRFDAAADKLYRTATLPSLAGPWTILFWAYKVANNAYGTICECFDGGLGYSTPSLVLGHEGNGTTLTVWNNGGSNTSGGTWNTATWTHFCLQRGAAANRTDVYINRNPTATIQSTFTHTGTATRGLEFGSIGSGDNDPGNYRLAALMWWDVVVSPDNWLTQSLYYRPCVELAGLQGWYPCVHPTANSNATDFSALARTFTTGGTLTVEDGPPIAWAPRRRTAWRAGAPPSIGAAEFLAAARLLTRTGGLIGRVVR